MKLCEEIDERYDSISTHVPVFSKNRKRSVAEIDVIAKKGKKIDVFEVKCSYRKMKAKKQLKRIKRLFPRVRRTFFFCGEAGILEEVVVESV